MHKLTSRKFWMAVGGSAAGIATLVTGLSIPDDRWTLALTIIGACLTAISIVAYNFAEAYVDGKAAASETLAINANTTSASTVEKLIADKEPVIKIGGTD